MPATTNDCLGFAQPETLMQFVLRPWHRFLVILASWINRQQQEVIEYLRTENAVLKEKLGKGRILLNDDQRRRLAANGKILGRKQLEQIGALFTPDTILRWHRQLVANKWDYSDRKEKNPGRPRIRQEIVDLTLQFAKENPTWGYDRVQGELAKLGYRISDTTVRARELTNCEDGFLNGKRYLIIDRDSKFCESFREFLNNEGITSVRLPPRTPNMNAHLERFFGLLKSECPHRLILFGEKAARNAVRQYLAHYHTERCQQGLGNQLIVPLERPPGIGKEIETTERLGGLLRSYRRTA